MLHFSPISFFIYWLVLQLCVHDVLAENGPIVATADGKLRGVDHGSHYSFKGVRYANPPVRFTKATPVDKWEGVADATTFGSGCSQNPVFHPFSSEDCLFINIWTPKKNDTSAKKFPVMFFIHGGHFMMSSGNDIFIDGEHYAKKGAILISFNFRLGLLGFFAHPQLTQQNPSVPTNFGLLDQILALKWVHRNIQYFGGDASQITIFGGSAGAASVQWLLSSAEHKQSPLFSSAIMQSPPTPSYPTELEAAEKLGVKVAEYFECDGPQFAAANHSVIECLRAIPALELVFITRAKRTHFVTTAPPASSIFGIAEALGGPHADKVNFPQHPFASILSSDSEGDKTNAKNLAGYNFIVGTNEHEWMFFMWYFYMFYKPPESYFAATIDKLFNSTNYVEKHPELLRAVNRLYPNEKYRSQYERVADISGDIFFFCPSFLYAQTLHDRGANVYFYVFAHQAVHAMPDYGVYHAVELPFIFGKPVQKIKPAQIMSSAFTEEEQEFSHEIIRTWINLGSSKSGAFHFGKSEWPALDRQGNEILWMNISEPLVVIPEYKVEQCKLWAQVFPGPLYFVNVDVMADEPFLSKVLNEYLLILARYAARHIKTTLGVLLVGSLFFLVVAYKLVRKCFAIIRKPGTKKKTQKAD